MHVRTLRVLLCLLMNKKVSAMDDFVHDNTCLYHLEYDNEKYTLLKENDLTHLNLFRD